MWNFDLGSQFNVEFLPVYISSTRGIMTQEGVKIQQRDQNSTAKEAHNSTKNPLNIDPGSVFNGGVKILSYIDTGQRLALHVFLVHRFFPQVTYFHFAYAIGGRPFDSEGGAGILLK